MVNIFLRNFKSLTTFHEFTNLELKQIAWLQNYKKVYDLKSARKFYYQEGKRSNPEKLVCGNISNYLNR